MAVKRIGYGKLGRVIEMDQKKWGESGGDNEPAALLLTLARRNPDVTWVVVGRNSGWVPPLPNIENPWQEWNKELKGSGKLTTTQVVQRLDAVTMKTIAELDGITLWLGQHGTSNSPIPKVKVEQGLTSPQISFVHYCSFLMRGINAWRASNPIDREEIWLLPDARNYIKGRDLKWPRRHPILCQYDWERTEWMERYGDPRSPKEMGFEATAEGGMWRAKDSYIGSTLELVGIPEDVKPHVPWEDRVDFGVLINEARNYGMKPEMTRLHAMQNYILPLDPSWIYGTWSQPSLEKLGRAIGPLAYDKIWPQFHGTKSTFTTPSSGSRWATAKPWECFATGTICFFHPQYDTQGHIIPTLTQSGLELESELHHLAKWLRITSPDDLARKVKAVATSRETYEWLAGEQHKLLLAAQKQQRCVSTIERRLGL